ncbi:hypothetical protein ACI782_20090 [Geodermatophilus sp. SYSU D00703]
MEFDDGPTGFPPAGRLLADGAPSLTELLRRGRVGQDDLAAEHLRRGSWTLRRRWPGTRCADGRADRTTADEQAMASPPDRAWTPEDAALAAVAGTLGLLGTPRTLPTEELLEQTGPVRWLVELVVEEVDQAISRGRFMIRAVTWADGTPG